MTAPITTLTDLRNHLQVAIGLELTTIPTYLYALYSIEEGANTAAVELIESVVLEEMLHMALAANVLNAIGGRPSTRPITGLGYSPVPTYPATVPLIPAIPPIHLSPLTPTAVDLFLEIERPVEPKPPPKGRAASAGYGSIGEFYDAIRDGLERLGKPSVFARGALKKLYREDFDQTQCVTAVVQALYDAADDDSATGGPDVGRRIWPTVGIVDDDGARFVPDDEIAPVVDAIIAARVDNPGGAR